MRAWILSLLWVVSCVHAAEVVPIVPVRPCFLCSNEPSLTLYWAAPNAKAVLILIPGGEGHIGLKPGQTDHPFHQFQSLKRLSDPALTRGQVSVVLLDSPAPLSPNQMYPSARGSSDHLIRIESVMRHYQTLTDKPIWLMGHSNGGISLMEFVRYARQLDKPTPIAGIVASGIRNESRFEAPIAFPMLFLHHAQDDCRHTMPEAARRNHDAVRAFNKAETAYVEITGGQGQAMDPCRSGFHMYFGAGEEAAKAIDDFMARHLP